MEIEYKNGKVAFDHLLPNATFIFGENLYVKTKKFTRPGDICKLCNCIRLKDLEFEFCDDFVMVKPVKAKVVVEED